MKFSIVTACLNRQAYLPAAIDSVVAQNYPSVEQLIVDGGSTDRSLEIAAGYPHVRTISEPDRGVYDAFNKGIEMSTGDIVGILNSDDLYAPDTFHEVAKLFADDPDLMVVSGKAARFVDSPHGARQIVEEWGDVPADRLTLDTIPLWGPIINARFMRRSIYEAVGLFDLSHGLSADCEFMLRLALTEPPALHLPKITCLYRSHPGSLTMDLAKRNAEMVVEEKLRVAEVYLAGGATLDTAQQRSLVRWHNIQCCMAIATFVKMRQPRAALHYLRRGSHRGLGFWSTFVGYTAGILGRKLKPTFG